MRTFEIVLLVVVAFAVLLPAATGERLKRGRAAALLGAALVTQLVVEGHRWQLWPLELTAVGLALGDLVWEDRRVKGLRRLRRGVLGGVGLAALLVLPALLPVPELPRPPGAFAIGTSTVELVDPERPEPYGRPAPAEGEPASGPPTGARRFVAQVWYPAREAGSAPVPWTTDFEVVGPALARRMGLPGFFLGHLEGVPSHARAGAEPLSGRFPVILYSHGWGGFRTIALSQVEALASHGYLVVAPDHAHAAIATRLSDGTVVRLDPSALPDPEEVDEEEYARAAELLVETMAADLKLVLDRLEEGDTGPFGELASHADPTAVGAFGHSAGGGAAVRVCIEDERCRAVLGLDAWVEPVPDEVIADELGVPSLFLRSGEWQDTPNDRRLRGLAERSPAVSHWIGLATAAHSDLVDTPLLSPIADRLGLKGPIEGERVMGIVRTYLVAFFDRYVLEVGGAALDEPPPPEVELETLE